MKILLFITLSLFTGWCSRFHHPVKEKPLAQVGDYYLYPSDLKGLIKTDLSKEDSTAMVASLIEKWIRKQVILQRAELNLTTDEKDVEQELDEYKTSLLIYKYEQKYINEKLDTIVRLDEIENYYSQNTANFTLNYNVVKALYVKLPLNVPHLDKFKSAFSSNNDESVKFIESYCFQNAAKYDYFNDQWISFDDLKAQLPINANIENDADLLKSRRIIEAKDSAYLYFVKIREYQAKGSTSPLKIVKEDIRNIIILKRKQKLVTDLENKIYFDALNRNNFTIYDKK